MPWKMEDLDVTAGGPLLSGSAEHWWLSRLPVILPCCLTSGAVASSSVVLLWSSALLVLPPGAGFLVAAMDAPAHQGDHHVLTFMSAGIAPSAGALHGALDEVGLGVDGVLRDAGVFAVVLQYFDVVWWVDEFDYCVAWWLVAWVDEFGDCFEGIGDVDVFVGVHADPFAGVRIIEFFDGGPELPSEALVFCDAVCEALVASFRVFVVIFWIVRSSFHATISLPSSGGRGFKLVCI